MLHSTSNAEGLVRTSDRIDDDLTDSRSVSSSSTETCTDSSRATECYAPHFPSKSGKDMFINYPELGSEVYTSLLDHWDAAHDFFGVAVNNDMDDQDFLTTLTCFA